MNELANQRFRKIAQLIHDKIRLNRLPITAQPDAFTYRWQHTLRVTQYGKQLAEAEGGNLELCISACLLHDLAKFENQDYGVEHGRVGAKMARPMLRDLGYSAAEIGNICFSIAVHVDDKADFEHPVTLESQIVNDADNIDRFSIYRIVSNLATEIHDYETLIKNAENRILRLKSYGNQNMMATATGTRLFNQQLNLQIMFLERLIAEGNITFLPEI
jgi:uncharacterized protein